MFGYVIPPLEGLAQEERDRFAQIYCGLCHTLKTRCGQRSRMILNYDFTFLAILLSDEEAPICGESRCPSSPITKKCYQESDEAMNLAADESVILAYWQLRDGVADHGFWKGLKYRFLSRQLHFAYRKAAACRPEFDTAVQTQLQKLAKLETENCTSMDQAADTFAELLAAAADGAENLTKRRVLRQMLYHLGRWVYLMDAADDLKKDTESGGYNPLRARFDLQDGVLTEEVRKSFTTTLDHSIHMIATAYELWDFGIWSKLLEATVYEGLFQVGRAVLDGTFHTGFFGKKKDKIVEETA